MKEKSLQKEKKKKDIILVESPGWKNGEISDFG